MMFAMRKGWILQDPCQIRGGSQAPEVKNPVIPTREQVAQIIEKSPTQYKALFAIAAWGGLRKGELLELRREDLVREIIDGETFFKVTVRRSAVWLQEGKVEIRKPKWDSDREVILPSTISNLIREHLREIPLNPNALLFPTKPNQQIHLGNHKLNRVWSKIRNDVNYSGSLHTLRSFSGTIYAEAGATLRETMDRLGHQSSAAAIRYQKNSGRQIQLVKRLG
jgi:integrase